MRYPVVRNFNEIALSCTVKEIEANLRLCIFGQNAKIQNGRHFKGIKIFGKLHRVVSKINCGSKLLTKSLYLARLRRQKQICILGENAKIQNGCHF